jgi:phage terminase large subunit-like protein
MFEKNEKQEKATEILSNRELVDLLLYGGGRSGKTAWAIYTILSRAIWCPSRHLIARSHFSHAKQAVWYDTLPKVLKLMDSGLPINSLPNKSDFFYKIPTRFTDPEGNIIYSEIWLGGLDNAERTEKILGREFSTIFLSEISQISYDSFLTVKTRLAEKNELRKLCFCDENPPSKKHWTYKYFIEKIDPIDKRPLDKSTIDSIQMNPIDNLKNIDPAYLKMLDQLPERKRKRFKDGVFQEEGEGKIFKEAWIKRTWDIPKDMRVIIGVDPAVTKTENSDEYGITVMGRSGDHGFLLADLSKRCTPGEMSQIVLKAYKDYQCSLIVVETNNGGDHIEAVIRHDDKFIPIKQVRATKGKVKRATPVGHLYEKGLIYHCGYFPDLEDEMWTFTEDESEMRGLPSPNRVDALCWSASELFDLNYSEPRIRMI